MLEHSAMPDQPDIISVRTLHARYEEALARLIHEHRSSTDARRLVVWDRGVFFTATERGLVERARG